MSIVKLEDVSWIRDGKTILDRVNWEIEPRQHWAVIGANGSGKSTILNMIAGYIWPTKGHVTVLGSGYGTCDLREVRKSIGWVTSTLGSTFQESRPFETAHDVVVSGRYASVGVYDEVDPTTNEEADALLKVFQIETLRDQPFRTLSQGERQRTLLARAWMANPKLLILDEPCTGLDILARETLLSSLSRMATTDNAPTILYVTHHVEEILPFFTHALLVSDGSIVAAGSKENVLTSSGLSKSLGIGVEVIWDGGRPWARVSQGALG